MRTFPFPDKIMSREELTRDLLFKKIPLEDLERISDMAWEIGKSAALSIVKEHGYDKHIEEIATAEKLIIERVNRDNVVGSIRYFSEYYSGRNKIVLYMDSIKKWAKMNKVQMYEAEELVLSHEYFHFLECTKLGLTSQQYTVPTISIGPISFGKSGIRALSEVGAHGFSRTFYELRGCLNDKEMEKKDSFLSNKAVNPLEFDSKQRAKKIFNIGIKSILKRIGERRE